jgi:hypothetical protein
LEGRLAAGSDAARAAPDHISSGEIAGELDYDEANAYTVLDALQKAGHVERVEGFTPRRYRMTVKHGRNRILRLSRLVPGGRWTTRPSVGIAPEDIKNG